MRRDVALRPSFYYEVIILGYIYFCRVKNQPRKGYIGQDSRDISTLARIKEHIDAAYSPNSKWDGCAAIIRVAGCFATEWAMFDQSQSYGLPAGVLENFKECWAINGSDLDVAETLHIIGSHMTSDISATYNKQMGGQRDFNLTYKWPVDDKYGLALQEVFGDKELPKIEIVRWDPASSWQKAIYPGQYQILKTFFDNYIITKIKDKRFLNSLYSMFPENDSLKAIINIYIDQYITYTIGKKKVLFKETMETRKLWTQFKKDVENYIQTLLWGQDDIKKIITTLEKYQIHINLSMFDWAELAKRIQAQTKEKIYGTKRQQTFKELFNNHVDLKKTIKEQDLTSVINEVIASITHNLYDQSIPLQLGDLNHSFFYKKDITPPQQTMPIWAQKLSNYRIPWGITPQQQDMIFQWSRHYIYRSIDKVAYTDPKKVREAIERNDYLVTRIRSASPFNNIHFENWTEWIREVLTAYTVDYKGSKKFIVQGEDNGQMFRSVSDPQDTKRYY